MKTEDSCRFIPVHKDYYSLHIVNFVLETGCKTFKGLKVESLNKIFLVTDGTGIFHVTGSQIPVSRGNLFFTMPSMPFAIQAKSDSFKYMYISFLGNRGNILLDQLKINSKNFMFSGFESLENFWNLCINCDHSTSLLKSESALLYTFAVLNERLTTPPQNYSDSKSIANNIKKYLDDYYTNSKLNLNNISTELNYNQKYISTVFKKEMGIGISKYLNTIRIQHACSLIAQDFESVSDISYQSGFSDPQYFSSVFKKHIGTSPKKHIKLIKSQKQ